MATAIMMQPVTGWWVQLSGCLNDTGERLAVKPITMPERCCEGMVARAIMKPERCF